MNIERVIDKIMEWGSTRFASKEETARYASMLLLEELKQTTADELSKHLEIRLLKKERKIEVTLSFPWNPTDSNED